MKNIELNKMLIKTFPNLSDIYQEEIEWQEGDETGSHTVYGDVFTPYIRKCIESNDSDKLKRIFDFLELLLSKQDKYINEVVAFSVIESLEYLLKENKEIIDIMGNKTKKVLEEM